MNFLVYRCVITNETPRYITNRIGVKTGSALKQRDRLLWVRVYIVLSCTKERRVCIYRMNLSSLSESDNNDVAKTWLIARNKVRLFYLFFFLTYGDSVRECELLQGMPHYFEYFYYKGIRILRTLDSCDFFLINFFFFIFLLFTFI